MSYQELHERRSAPARIVAIYVLAGFAWIYGSDTVLGWLVHDPVIMVKLAVAKGFLFILCTATLLYFLISRFARQLAIAENGRIENLKDYETIFNTTNEAIFVHDTQSGHILDINNRTLEIFGYEREEALTLDVGRLSEGSPPYSQAEAVAMVRKAESEGPQVFEWLCRKKAGELFWTEVSLSKISTRQCDRIIAVVRDINERKLLDNALRASEERHRTILNSAMDGFWLVNRHGRLLEVNEAYCRMSGYSRQELLTMSIADLDANESATDAIDHNQKIIAQGEDRFVCRHRRKDGTVFDVEVSAKYMPVDGGLFVGFQRDITARNLAERALRESEDKILSLVNSVPGHIAFVNADTLQYEFVNNAFEKSFGIPRAQFVGSHISKIIGEANYQFALKYIDEVRAGKAVSYENTFNLVSGTRWVQVNYTPVFDGNGNVTSIVVLSLDITNIKEHEKEQLKIEKLESLGILAGGIAHDFNNILTGIMGNISLAKMFIDSNHRAFAPLVGAEKASVRATELSRQLLTFARGGEPIKRVVSIRQIINDAVSLALHGSNVKGVVDIPDAIHAMEADEGQLSQVCHNIIINAAQATPGGGTLTIAAWNERLDIRNILSLPAGTYVCITFADEGCGIAANDLEKIFDPYFTTKSNGSGLGLASTHSIILKHGGLISAASRPGKGTTFTVHLPSIGETFAEYQIEAVSRSAADHRDEAILVMDDEEMIRDFLTAMLEELGYRVTACVDGAKAIEHYHAAREAGIPFFAALMDLTIPGGMGGKEAAQRILALDPAARLIVSSGYSNDPIMSDYHAYGFAGAITKPYRVDELAQLLGSLS